MKPALLLGLGDFQKVNHFPRIHDITRKDLMVRTLNAMRQAHGAAEFDFVPATYVLPADTEALVAQVASLARAIATCCQRLCHAPLCQRRHAMHHCAMRSYSIPLLGVLLLRWGREKTGRRGL